MNHCNPQACLAFNSLSLACTTANIMNAENCVFRTHLHAVLPFSVYYPTLSFVTIHSIRPPPVYLVFVLSKNAWKKQYLFGHYRSSLGICPSTALSAPRFTSPRRSPTSWTPARRATHSITSSGSRRCDLANVTFVLAPTVTVKTWLASSTGPEAALRL